MQFRGWIQRKYLVLDEIAWAVIVYFYGLHRREKYILWLLY